MKKKNLYPLSDLNEEASGIVKDDPKRIEAYDLFFGKNRAGLVDKTRVGPVNPDFVDECIASYSKGIVKGKVFTNYVEFGSSTLADWIQEMKNGTNTTDFRLYLGVYSEEASIILEKDTKVSKEDKDSVRANRDRLTIIIRPYKDSTPASYKKDTNGFKKGDPAKSYNLGNIHP
ncbi:MAG: hypothetical protein H7Y07_15245 [Pyrinomonadaceae bacterium]|nr:hypothetical protein [Sphingobacteriaceae bacterium]